MLLFPSLRTYPPYQPQILRRRRYRYKFIHLSNLYANLHTVVAICKFILFYFYLDKVCLFVRLLYCDIKFQIFEIYLKYLT